MVQTTGCGITSSHFTSGLPGAKALRWFAGLVLAAGLAACGGGGSEPADALTESANNASCSYEHLYITVEQVRVRQQVDGGERWTDIALAAPQRIDLMNLGDGLLLNELGASPLAAGHYTEVRLILAASEDGSGLANAVQPTGGNLTSLSVPGSAQSGLKLKGDFMVPTGQTGDVVLQGFNPCEAIMKTGNSNSPRHQLKPELPASVELATAAAAPPEARIASGSVMPLTGGGYVVSRMQGTDTWVVQRYGADGQPVGAEATIVPPLIPDDWGLKIAPLTGGGYAVMWIRLVLFERFGGSVYQVMTQSFTAAGAPIGGPLSIAQTIPGRYWISRPIAMPQIAALTGGGYVAVWGLQSHTDSAVYAQRFNADGTPAAAVHQVAPAGTGYFGVTGLTTGGYMVTWGGAEGATGFVRAYSSTDTPLGSAQPAGPSWSDFFGVGGGDPTFISPLAGGGAVMVWVRFESSTSSTPYVHVLQLAPDATPLGAARIVDGSTAPANGHAARAVVGLTDGGYVVAWIEVGEVHARRFAADGTPAAEEMRINQVTTSVEEPLDVVALAGGGFMITWSGVGTDGVRSNYGRVF